MSSVSRLRTVLQSIALLAILAVVAAVGSVFVLTAEDNPLSSNPMPIFALLAVFLVAWLGVVVLNFYEGWQGSPDANPESHPVASSSDAPPADRRDRAQRHLAQFRRSNLSVGGLLALCIGTYLVLEAVAGGSASNGPLGIAYGIMRLAVRLFGGLSTLLALTVLFLAVWYGLRREATEALFVGVLLWGLIGLVGLSAVSATATGFGFVIGGAYGVYTGFRARSSTEPRFFTDASGGEY